MTAIENNLLAGTRLRIEQAKDQRVDRYAPETLARAESLLAEAEASLRRDRYDTDYPRTLAREANYEARHASYLATRIRALQDRDITAEKLLLEPEGPMIAIAGELDIVAEFDQGFEPPGQAVLSAVDALTDDRETLRQRDEQIAVLQDELASLEAWATSRSNVSCRSRSSSASSRSMRSSHARRRRCYGAATTSSCAWG